MAFLTVFTPAYNRAHTLPRTYESLCQQDCKDFIWLIVDDGSTDETADLVKGWKKEKNGICHLIPHQYLKKKDHNRKLNQQRQTTGERIHVVLFVETHHLLVHLYLVVRIFFLNYFHPGLNLLHFSHADH